MLLTGLAEEGWLQPRRWSRGEFAERFGNFSVRVNDARYDPEKMDELVSVQEYLELAMGDRSVVAVGYDTPLSRALVLQPDAPLPPLLEDFQLRPVVQLAAELHYDMS